MVIRGAVIQSSKDHPLSGLVTSLFRTSASPFRNLMISIETDFLGVCDTLFLLISPCPPELLGEKMGSSTSWDPVLSVTEVSKGGTHCVPASPLRC